MWDGINNRKFPRIAAQFDADVKIDGTTDHISTITENVGAGGVAIVLDTKLQKFAQVNLRLDINDEKEPISCNGRVVWIIEKRTFGVPKSSYDIGIEFVDLEDGDKSRIRQLIDSRGR